MYVRWALAKKQTQNDSQQQRRSSILDVLGKIESEQSGHNNVILYTAHSKPESKEHWEKLPFHEGNRPKINKQNGNVFFPYIKVKATHKSFKVYFGHMSVGFCRHCNVMASQYSCFFSAALQLRNEHHCSAHDTSSSASSFFRVAS